MLRPEAEPGDGVGSKCRYEHALVNYFLPGQICDKNKRENAISAKYANHGINFLLFSSADVLKSCLS